MQKEVNERKNEGRQAVKKWSIRSISEILHGQSETPESKIFHYSDLANILELEIP